MLAFALIAAYLYSMLYALCTIRVVLPKSGAAVSGGMRCEFSISCQLEGYITKLVGFD